jgi:hypothetical protein
VVVCFLRLEAKIRVCLFDVCMFNYQSRQVLYMYLYHQNITPGWGCVGTHACRYAPFYLRNSNAQVKSECDYIDEEIGVKSGLGSLAGVIQEVGHSSSSEKGQTQRGR